MTPDDRLGIGVLVQVLFELLPWEWVQLLDTSNGRILDVVICPVLYKSSVDLTRAKDDSFYLGWLVDRLAVFGVRNDPFELRVTSEVLN